MTDSSLTKRQQNALGKIFTKGRLSGADISASHNVGSSVIVIKFPEGRTDKVRLSEDGMFLGHWRSV